MEGLQLKVGTHIRKIIFSKSEKPNKWYLERQFWNHCCDECLGENKCDQFVVVVQSVSHVQLFETPWTAAGQASLSFTISWSLLKLLSIELVMPSIHLVLCRPLLLLLSVYPSIRVFYNQSILCIRWPKYWSFSISPSNEYSGFISFRMDWFDPLAVQRTLKGLLQHHSSKASILQCSAFFMVQLSHPFMMCSFCIVLCFLATSS